MKASELSRFADISYRQMDYWVKQGYLVPDGEIGVTPGSGHSREFPEKQCRKARTMRCLLALGMELNLAERIAHFYEVEGNKSLFLGHGVTVTLESHTH